MSEPNVTGVTDRIRAIIARQAAAAAAAKAAATPPAPPAPEPAPHDQGKS